jgi:hypothetical protein
MSGKRGEKGLFLIWEYLFMEKKKELVSAASSKHQRAGDGTRTRDSLLGKQELYH